MARLRRRQVPETPKLEDRVRRIKLKRKKVDNRKLWMEKTFQSAKRDPYYAKMEGFKGARSVPLDGLDRGAGAILFDQVFSAPDTHMLFNADGAYRQLYTRMPDGTVVAWNSCQRCHNDAVYCSCGGVVVSRSVEHIYDKIRAKLAKEEWDVHHPNYRGSIVAAHRAALQLEHERKQTEARKKRMEEIVAEKRAIAEREEAERLASKKRRKLKRKTATPVVEAPVRRKLRRRVA